MSECMNNFVGLESGSATHDNMIHGQVVDARHRTATTLFRQCLTQRVTVSSVFMIRWLMQVTLTSFSEGKEGRVPTIDTVESQVRQRRHELPPPRPRTR